MKKFWLLIASIFVLTACTGTEASVDYPSLEGSPQLENLGKAPELTSKVWLNTDQHLRLADLRGQVVLLEMWTFG